MYARTVSRLNRRSAPTRTAGRSPERRDLLGREERFNLQDGTHRVPLRLLT
jgi:hypothetical protein